MEEKEEKEKLEAARVFVGTSGFSYSHWRGVFYPEKLRQKDWLLYYAKHFDTVEINATFYHQMRPKTFENWRKIVGPEFVFSIKASRFITHVKRLKGCQEALEKLMEGVEALRAKKHLKEPSEHFFSSRQSLLKERASGHRLTAHKKREALSKSPPFKKGSLGLSKTSSYFSLDVVLFQLPPRWEKEESRLKEFVKILPKDFRFAFEFRDRSWLTAKIYKILESQNCALVIQDSPYWPTAEEVTADFTYLRFHGSKRLYSSCYSERELKKWAEKIKEWFKKGIDVYAYFNNDALGYAVENAKTLRNLVRRSTS